MRLAVISIKLLTLFTLTLVVTGYARAQDFSITNQVEPADVGRRDVMRQLQAWWNVHAYYPRHASQSDEGGTVRVHLMIHPDGNIMTVDVVESSGSRSLDTAGSSVFRGGFVRPFPADSTAPDLAIDISLHYVLAHRHDQPMAAGYTPAVSKSAFTKTNDPDPLTVVNTMLQRTCTGTVVRNGWRNHPNYGSRSAATAIFFRKPDGTPWITFYEGGFPILSPVTEVGKLAQWTGRAEPTRNTEVKFAHYSVWPDGENRLTGEVAYLPGYTGYPQGTIDLTCTTDIAPAVTWSALSATPGPSPPGDPP